MEALFLHVWLKREEQKIKHAQVMAQGLADIASSQGAKTSIPERFREYMVAVLPYMEKEMTSKDDQMKEALKKMSEIGSIPFEPLTNSPLGVAAKRLSRPDSFEKSMTQKAKQTRKLT